MDDDELFWSSDKGCDFETTCDWENLDVSGGLVWTNHSGSTTSVETGPMVDHTKGNDQGELHRQLMNPTLDYSLLAWLLALTIIAASFVCILGRYLYVETSLLDANSSALYRSPLYNFTTPSCLFRFAYHMVGTHIGTLEVRAVDSGGSLLYMWQREGQQPDQWILGGLPLPGISSPFRIEIQATHTDGFQGDIAVDDLEFVFCNPGENCLFGLALSVLCIWCVHCVLMIDMGTIGVSA